MSQIEEVIKTMNIPKSYKTRINTFMKNQQKKILEESVAYENTVKHANKNTHKDTNEGNNKDSQTNQCKICRNLGYILTNNEAKMCNCQKIKRAKELLIKSQIHDRFKEKTLDNFNYKYNMQVAHAYEKAMLYVKNFENLRYEKSNSILFAGQVGSGKTHLSIGIANKLMDVGVPIIYMSYRDIITQIKQNITNIADYQRLVNKYKNASVLLIDDLFKGSITKSDINIMFEIINHRYFNNLPVIISTEQSVNSLLEIDEALGSRIIEMCKKDIIQLKGVQLNYRIYGDE